MENGGYTPMSETERLKENIRENDSRTSELIKSIEAVVNSFSEESKAILGNVDKVEVQLEEADQRIAAHEQKISALEEKKQTLRSELVTLEQQVKDLDRKISSITTETGSTTKELIRTEESLKQYTSKIGAAKTEMDKLDGSLAESQESIDKTRSSNEREFQERRAGFEDAQRRIKNLVEREPVIDFLLTEASSEPPEIAIVAGLIRGNGAASLDDLKRITKVPPAITVRTVNALEQKGVVAKEGTDKIRLVKTLA
jgi:chromosome segregation ATPase